MATRPHYSTCRIGTKMLGEVWLGGLRQHVLSPPECQRSLPAASLWGTQAKVGRP